MVRCDIEGVSGVVSYEQAEPGRPEYEFGHRMFMADLIALVEGLKAGGADEVVIYDERYYGRNIDISKLPKYATAICGKPPYRPDWAGGLLPHSCELDIADLRIGGASVGVEEAQALLPGVAGVVVKESVSESGGVCHPLSTTTLRIFSRSARYPWAPPIHRNRASWGSWPRIRLG